MGHPCACPYVLDPPGPLRLHPTACTEAALDKQHVSRTQGGYLPLPGPLNPQAQSKRLGGLMKKTEPREGPSQL